MSPSVSTVIPLSLLHHILLTMEQRGLSYSQSMKMLLLFTGTRMNVYMRKPGIYHHSDFNRISVALKYRTPHQMIQEVEQSGIFIFARAVGIYGCDWFASTLYMDLKEVEAEQKRHHHDNAAPLVYRDHVFDVECGDVRLPGHDETPWQRDTRERDEFLAQEEEIRSFIFSYLSSPEGRKWSVPLWYELRSPSLYQRKFVEKECWSDFDRWHRFGEGMAREHVSLLLGSFIENYVVRHIHLSKKWARRSVADRKIWIRNLFTGRYGDLNILRYLRDFKKDGIVRVTLRRRPRGLDMDMYPRPDYYLHPSLDRPQSEDRIPEDDWRLSF